MRKNEASQKLTVFAFDATTNLPKTGDAANLTAYVRIDSGTLNALGDTSATEVSSTNAAGYYEFDLTQAETNGNRLLFTCKSSTSNIVVVCTPAMVFTTPPNYQALSVDSNGRVDVIKIAGTTQTARDLGASVLLSSGTGTGQLSITSGVVNANAVQISDDSTAADNAEAAFDGTGYNVGGGRIVTTPQKTIYLDDGGNDSNDGLSPATAKLTISAAVTAAGTGGTVRILPGTYSGAYTLTLDGVTLEGVDAASCVLTHNSGPTLTINSRVGTTLRNLTIANTAETSSGTGLYCQSTTGTRIERCIISGKLDAAHFGSSSRLHASQSSFAGAFDGTNATDLQGEFDLCRFSTDGTHSLNTVRKHGFYMDTTAGLGGPRIVFRNCEFIALQFSGTNTGELCGCNACGMVSYYNCRFSVTGFHASFNGNITGLRAYESSGKPAQVYMEGGGFVLSTLGSGTIKDIDASGEANSRVEYAGIQTLYGVAGAVVDVSPAASEVNAAVEAGAVGTNAAAILEDTGTTLPASLTLIAADAAAANTAAAAAKTRVELALPSIAPNAAGGIITFGTSSGQLNVTNGAIASLGVGAIGSGTLGAGSITATSIATDAFTETKFSTGAITEIQGGLAQSGAQDILQASIDALPAPLTAAETRAALGLGAADLDDQLEAIEAGGGAPDTRDLEPPQWIWRLSRRSGAGIESPLPLRIAPGESIRAGFDCKTAFVLPTGAVVASFTNPTGLTDPLTATKTGTNGQYCTMTITADADATVGTEQTVSIEMTNSLGDGPVTLSARVIVVAE